MALLFEKETYEVYKQLGNGFLEAVYQEAMEYQLTKNGVSFESQKLIQICYDGKVLRQFYKEILFPSGFNTPPLWGVNTGGVGDLFPHKRNAFKVKSSIPRGSAAGIFYLL